MKKITIFIGSQKKQFTYQAVQEFIENLNSYTQINFEYVFLTDNHLEYCIGCKQCFKKGEEYCPLKDDRDLLLNKIKASDGVIFATPNYAFQVTAPMKNFFDRLAFIFHRPCFFDKAFTSIVTQGIYGGSSIVKYLEFIGKNLGFHVAKGCCINTLEPRTKKQLKNSTRQLNNASKRFYKELMRPNMPKPSFIRLIAFRISRTNIKILLDDNDKDFRYYKEKGWFESPYYYDVPLSLLKKLTGRFFDILAKQISSRRNSQ